MTTKSVPFNQHEAENRVISRIAQASHMTEDAIRRLVKSEDAETSDKLADGLRIEELNAKYGNKLCPTCGSSVG